MKLVINQILLAIIFLTLGFMIGKQNQELASFQKQSAYLIDIMDLLSIESSESRSLISIYEAYANNPSEAQEYVKRLIAMRYKTNKRITDLLGRDYGPNNRIYENNKIIEEFLVANPIVECQQVSSVELLSCNLENIHPKSKVSDTLD